MHDVWWFGHSVLMICYALYHCCSADGLVMMGSISLVLDGLMSEPPTVALPPSAVATSAATAAAVQMAMGPNSSLAATGLAAGE